MGHQAGWISEIDMDTKGLGHFHRFCLLGTLWPKTQEKGGNQFSTVCLHPRYASWRWWRYFIFLSRFLLNKILLIPRSFTGSQLHHSFSTTASLRGETFGFFLWCLRGQKYCFVHKNLQALLKKSADVLNFFFFFGGFTFPLAQLKRTKTIRLA